MASKQTLVDYARKTLQKWFEDSGFSQQQVAERMGWKQQTSVSHYFTGRSDLSLDQVSDLAVILGHSVEEIVNAWAHGSSTMNHTVLSNEELQIVMACRRASSKLRPALVTVVNAATQKGSGK